MESTVNAPGIVKSVAGGAFNLFVDGHSGENNEYDWALAETSSRVGSREEENVLEVTSNKETLGKNINSDLKNCKATYINILGLDESIKKSKDLCESAINELKSIKSDEIDLLIELAKYICYREK